MFCSKPVMTDAHLAILGQLEQKYIWFKMSNLKKLSAWAESLRHEEDVAHSAPSDLKGLMISNVRNKKQILIEKVDQRLRQRQVFEEFFNLVVLAFPHHTMVRKKLREVVKMYSVFLDDAVKAKKIVR